MANFLIKALNNEGKRVAFIVDREELVKQSKATFGDNASIVKAGKDKEFNCNKPVQIIMIQTFYARRDKLPDMDLDVIIIDECHNNWNTGRINELLRIYPNAKIVGLSATPIDDKGWLLNGFDCYIEGLQGSELIKLGRLCPTVDYSFESYGLNLGVVKLSNGDYDTQELDQQVLDTTRVGMIVDEWERLAKDRKTLVFCNSIKHAEKVYAEFKKRGHNFELLHSKIDNRDCIDRLKQGDIQGIVSVSMTIAGLDCPDISCIVDARPTKVERIARQILGRGRRVAKGKQNNIHLDFANYYLHFGATDDDRYYSPRSERKNELEYVQCPECGNIEPIEAKECTICGYDLTLFVEELVKGLDSKKVSKKQLERLILIKSMQETLYNEVYKLVKERGHKQGYAWYLYKDLLKNAKNQGTGLIFYKKLLNRIEKCRLKGYKIRWLMYQ